MCFILSRIFLNRYKEKIFDIKKRIMQEQNESEQTKFKFLRYFSNKSFWPDITYMFLKKDIKPIFGLRNLAYRIMIKMILEKFLKSLKML